MAFTKGVAVKGFTFNLVNKSSGEPITAGVATGYVTLDGGVQVALADAPVHEGNGQWSVDISASEMNADIVGLLFTHPDALNEQFTVATNPATASSPVELEFSIEDAAASPKRTRTDEATVEERSISELIEADRYLASQNADEVPWGLRVARTKPGGTLGHGPPTN